MMTLAEFLSSLSLAFLCPILGTLLVKRLMGANGDASFFDGISLGPLLGGTAFVGLHHLTRVLADMQLVLQPYPLPAFALPSLVFGGLLLVWSAERNGASIRRVKVHRHKLRALSIAALVASAVWVGSWASSMPSPFDQRAIAIHGYDVPDVKYGGPLRWLIDATVRRQCDAETRYTVQAVGDLSVLPLWERSDKAGNARVQPRRVFDITARESFVVQDAGHENYLAPMPPGNYIFTAYRHQYCDGVRYDYSPVRVPFKVLP